jgi:hypothetical protein
MAQTARHLLRLSAAPERIGTCIQRLAAARLQQQFALRYSTLWVIVRGEEKILIGPRCVRTTGIVETWCGRPWARRKGCGGTHMRGAWRRSSGICHKVALKDKVATAQARNPVGEDELSLGSLRLEFISLPLLHTVSFEQKKSESNRLSHVRRRLM